MKLPFLSEMIAESMWRAMGLACDPKPNAVISTLQHAFEWRSTKWWQTATAIEMSNDPNIHTRWRARGVGTINSGCVWDRVASDWTDKEEWSSTRKRCQTTEDKVDFITVRTAERQNIRHYTGQDLETKKTTQSCGPFQHPSTSVKKDQRFSCVGAAMLPKNESRHYSNCGRETSFTLSSRKTTLPLYFWKCFASSACFKWQRSLRDG